MVNHNDTLLNSGLSIPNIDMPSNYQQDSILQSMSYDNILQFYTPTISSFENDTTYSTSVFENHLLKPRSFTKNEILRTNSDWIIVPFLLVFILYIYISTNFHQRWMQTIKAPFSKRYLGQLERDGNIFNETILFPMIFIVIISISMLFFLIIKYFATSSEIGMSESNIYLILFGVYLLFTLFKSLLIVIVGYVFDTQSESLSLILQNLLTLSISSIIIFPFLLTYAYSNISVFLYFSVIIIILFSIFKNIKAFEIWNKTYNYYKIFIYLCTVEILPYVLILKTAIFIITK